MRQIPGRASTGRLRLVAACLLLAGGLAAQPNSTPPELTTIKWAHAYASGGQGTEQSPYTYRGGNPWVEAVRDGGKVVLFGPGHYRVTQCPAVIPTGITLWGFSRETTVLRLLCSPGANREAVDGIQTSTDARDVVFHGFSIDTIGTKEGALRNVFRFHASESVIEEVEFRNIGAQHFNQAAATMLNAHSAALAFQASAQPGATVQLAFGQGRAFEPMRVGTNSSPEQLAVSFAKHLNDNKDFRDDFYAAPEGATVHLLHRKIAWNPGPVNVTASVATQTADWEQTGRGGNALIYVASNSFSSKFERIFCPGSYSNLHCVVLSGVNNQQSFRDIRFSAGHRGGWGFKFEQHSGIQQINLHNITVEAAYGGIDIGSMSAGSIIGVYMEAPERYGIRLNDIAGVNYGYSFVQGITILNPHIGGNSALALEKAHNVNVLGGNIFGGCWIGRECDNCVIQASWLVAGRCRVDSLTGYTQSFRDGDNLLRPSDQYATQLATDFGGILDRPLKNLVRRSDDLTAAPWRPGQGATKTQAEDPMGKVGPVTRITIPGSEVGKHNAVAYQAVEGLRPNRDYLFSFWVNVRTKEGVVSMRNISANRMLQASGRTGWRRVAGLVRSDANGKIEATVNYSLVGKVATNVEVDTWGVMLSEAADNGALPPYVPSGAEPGVVPAGLYLYRGAVTTLP